MNPDGSVLRPAPIGPPVSPRASGGRIRLLAAAALLGLLGVSHLMVAPRPEPAGAPAHRVAEDFGQLPLRFEANRGQTDPRVDFLSRGPGYTLFLTPSEAVLSLARGGAAGGRAVVRMRLAGADPNPRAEGVERLPGVSNYLTGTDPKRWRTGVPGFAEVRYAGVLPGIDLVYHGEQRSLEYDFVVAPGADPGAIALDFSGVRKLAVSPRGDLLAHTAGGSLRQRRPNLYQRVGGKRRVVAGRYVVEGRRVGFKVGAYDRSRPLVIDPILSYATYLGGTGSDTPNGIAVDSAGNAHLAGQTASTSFPTASALQNASGGGNLDAFVSKLNASGSALVYSTYLGGSGTDIARGIAVDSTGAYLTGETTSTNFPTAAPLQVASGGGTDAFLAKLNAAGSALVYSTYLGGSGTDVGRGIAVDSQKPSLTGSTASANFPTTNPVQAATGGGTDAFVARYSATGAARDYSTYLGGSAGDNGRGIAVAGDNAYVAGDTASANFPTDSPLQAANGGGTDAFVTKFNAAGSARDYSTYLGGGGTDNADGIAVLAGSAYVAGDTESANFPTASPIQGSYAGGGDAFVGKLNAAGSALSYSTYLGGAAFDGANGIAADATGRASIVGTTSSGDYPVVLPIAARSGNADMLAAQLNAAGSALAHSTPLGGNASESGTAIAAEGSGTAYLTGSSLFFANGDVATTTGAVQPNNAGSNDALVAKIVAHSTTAPLVTRLGTRSGPTSGGTDVEITGTGFTGTTAVRFGDKPAASFTVNSSTKITAKSPAGSGQVPVRVTTPAGTSPANPVTQFTYAVGSWERTGSLQTGRTVHTNTLLENGKVLIAGGRSVTGNSESLTSSELYDPKTGTFAATGGLAGARLGHTATLLGGPACETASRPAYCGKVLVAGGYTGNVTTNAQPVLDTAELYDPTTGTWSAADSLNTRRSLHAATPLNDGRVLVAGGRTCTSPPPATCNFMVFTNSAEVYDPTTDTWTTVGAMSVPHHTTDMALLPNGKALLPAGFPDSSPSLTTAELFNPATGRWSSCPTATPSPDCPGPLSIGRARSGATLLPNGKVIVAAGFPNTDTSELYDVATGTWTQTGKMATFGRFNYYSALLPDGRLLLAGGGNGGASSEIYDPATGQWAQAGVMADPHGTGSSNANSMKAVVLSSDPDRFEADPAVCGRNCGKVLITGNTELQTAELFSIPAAPQAAGVLYPGPAGSASLPGCPSATTNVRRGTSGNDNITGTAAGDRIFAGTGNDVVDALAGNDCVDLGPGTDRGQGGTGNDLLLGGLGRDQVSGGSGNDQIRGNADADRLDGGRGNDRVFGDAGNDVVAGAFGKDLLRGASGNDRITGGSDRDRISGGSGRDRIFGGGSNDRVAGNSGNDSIRGNSGADRISGGSGRDSISSGSGNDRVSARDRRRDRINCGSGRDRVVADRIDRVSRNCERVSRR